ncbi:MAG: hypothetical protein MUE53_04795 [Chitinophagales bacterium]|jgi:hypothetical protein|nr:hypothetical protein [Chitinophagales bacterium]
MIKPIATMMTIWGAIMFLATFLNYLNSPSFIEYNNAVKYSMVNSGMNLAFLFSSILLISGIVLLWVSRVKRDV